MTESFVSFSDMQDFFPWSSVKGRRALNAFSLEITARCNNNCRHCYINLPVGDRTAKERELSTEEITNIADQAVSLGALWCTISGGEPLVRPDFPDIYLGLKRKGLLNRVYTNATLINEEHVHLFKRYPPYNIEVTVYGVTKETYEAVTRRPGSYEGFIQGLDLLLENGIKVRLKAMALRSNLHEIDEIARFCRERTRDYYRFDPFLQLRFDGDAGRNEEIQSERLTPEEIVDLEKSDEERFQSFILRGVHGLCRAELL
jgi:MoaA/NifB/PqqE/SkfB family radical SAM enzyme